MAAGNLWVNLGLRSAAFDRGLAKSRKNIRGFGGQVQSLNRTVKGLAATFGLGLGLVGVNRVLGSSLRKFATFKKGMAAVSTMLNDQTMKFMPAYEKQVRGLAVEMGESTETLSSGLYDILSASVSASKAMKVLRVSTKAAKAGVTDTATAADAITTILNSYSMAAESATEISDKMFATIKRGKLTFGDYAPNIGKVASLAATAGVAFEDLNAAIATLTRAGVQTEIAMTGIRGTITALIDPSKEAIEAAAQFGLVLDQNTLRTVGLVGMMNKLRNADIRQLAAIIPNVRALAGFAAGIQNADGALKDLDMQMNAHGMTQKAFRKMMETTAADIDIWTQSWADFKISVGGIMGALIKDLRTVKTQIKDIVESIKTSSTKLTEAQTARLRDQGRTMAGMDAADIPGMTVRRDRIPPSMVRGPRPGTFKDPRDGRVYPMGTPIGILDPLTGRAAQKVSEMRAFVRPQEEAIQSIQEFRGEFPGAMPTIGTDQGKFMEHRERTRSKIQERYIQKEMKRLDDLKAKNEETAKIIKDRWEWVGQGMASSMTSAADQILFEAGKLRDGIKSILRQIARDTAQAFIFTPFSEALVAGVGQKFGMPVRTAPQHSGGFIPNDGLYSLQRGEFVNDRVSAKGGGAAPVVVIENKGVPLQQEGQPRFEADKWVISVVNDNIQNRGTLFHATRT